MNFVIISHVQHIKQNSKYFGYAPYVREMNIWLKYVEKVTVVAPIKKTKLDTIHLDYQHKNIKFKEVSNFNTTSFLDSLRTFLKLPSILWTIFWAMKNANHIHLRCPGNMGLLGCIVQILFPKTPKTAKYAGNWDPNAKQPLTYKIQKWILNTTFLTKNMQVLVYGEWEGSSKNIKSFFTATYSENEIVPAISRKTNDKIKFMFVGTLSEGKQPLYAVQLIEELKKKNIEVHLSVFGDGILREKLQEYIFDNNLKNQITLFGNQTKDTIKKAYQNNHFLVLPSKSEGWPKVVAEAMFFGCVPLTTSVSCVNYMIGNGNRGKILSLNLDDDATQVQNLIKNEEAFLKMSEAASSWSNRFTTEYFEKEIVKLITV